MNREDILAMKPGRELDALVAEKVMGWDVKIYLKQNGWWVRPEEKYEPFRPSTDISAAWEVVEKMREKHWAKVECGMSKGSIRCAFGKYGTEYATATFADTAPEAICKAALLAVMEARETA